jgi:hypothetical protein
MDGLGAMAQWSWGILRFGWREVLGSFELGMLAVIRLRSCFLGIAAMNQMTDDILKALRLPRGLSCM